MKISIKSEGLPDILKDLQRRGEAESAVKAGLNVIGADAVAAVTQAIESAPHTGKPYRHDGANFTASAPGGPPAKETGDLIDSIKLVPAPAGLGVLVVAEGAKAAALEFGTHHMPARPYLRPTVERVAQGETKKFADILTQADKGK